jgi:RNA polymerase-binding transcription factor DksA
MVDCIGTGCQREGLQAELAALRAERDEANRVCEQWKQWNDALRARVAELVERIGCGCGGDYGLCSSCDAARERATESAGGGRADK